MYLIYMNFNNSCIVLYFMILSLLYLSKMELLQVSVTTCHVSIALAS